MGAGVIDKDEWSFREPPITPSAGVRPALTISLFPGLVAILTWPTVSWWRYGAECNLNETLADSFQLIMKSQRREFLSVLWQHYSDDLEFFFTLSFWDQVAPGRPVWPWTNNFLASSSGQGWRCVLTLLSGFIALCSLTPHPVRMQTGQPFFFYAGCICLPVWISSLCGAGEGTWDLMSAGKTWDHRVHLKSAGKTQNHLRVSGAKWSVLRLFLSV